MSCWLRRLEKGEAWTSQLTDMVYSIWACGWGSHVARGLSSACLVMIPALTKGRNETLEQLSQLSVRVLSYVGTGTIVFGLFLVTRTRGYGELFTGEWGAIIIACIVIAVALLGIGDGGLRPALRRLPVTGKATSARRLALIGFALTLLAVAFMTRALYAP